MAKKFVKVTGINKALSYNSATNTWSILSTVSADIADENSILYITANSSDAGSFGQRYAAGSHWIYAKGQLFDGNDTSTTYFTGVTGISGDIASGDNIETIIRKLITKVNEAKKSGVQSLTTTDDVWVTVDPDLDASTGAVTLKLAHGAPGSAVNTKEGVVSDTSTWGGSATIQIPKISIDAKGHVQYLENSSSKTVVTLPSKPVTSLTTSGDSEVTATTNTKATGDVTVSVAHATHTAVKAGETADKKLTADASSFKVLEVSTNGTGHVISTTERTITLPENAFKNDNTTYGFAGGTQQFTVTTTVLDNGIPVSTEKIINVSHMSKGTGTASSADGTYVSGINTDVYGHVTAVASKTNGVYSEDKNSHGANEIAIWDGTNNKLKTSDKTIRTIAISANSSTSTIPTTSQVIDYVLSKRVTGAMTYKGTIESSANLPTQADKGDTYVLSKNDTSAGYEIGDMFIYNTSGYDRVPAGDANVTNYNPTLSYGTTQNIASIDGVKISAKMPAETQLSVESSTGASGLTYVSSVSKGTASHRILVKTSTIQAASTSQSGVVQLSDSSTSTSSTTAATSKVVAQAYLAAVGAFTEAAKKSVVSYSQTTSSAVSGAYTIGTITINGTSTTLYGKDNNTVYTHPSASSSGGTATATSTGTASATTVITAVNRDSTGHVTTVTTSDISAAYKQREVKVNGTTQIASTVTTALDLSAGSNVTLSYTNNKVQISATNTDTKVQDTASTAKAYLLGHATQNTTNSAYTNSSVYMYNGELHARSLYEGTWSVHNSSAGDWGTI